MQHQRPEWFVVSVAPRREVQVSKRSSQLGVSTFHPTGRRMQVLRGREVHSQVAVMPGYVFVQVDDPNIFSKYRRDLDAADVVPDCRGFVGADGPEPVPDAQMDELQARAARGEFDDVQKVDGRYWGPRWLRAGRKVRVIAGAFEGHVGEVWRLTASKRVSVFLTMLGGLRLVELDIEAVARAR